MLTNIQLDTDKIMNSDQNPDPPSDHLTCGEDTHPVEEEASWRCSLRLDALSASPRIAIAHWRDRREHLRELTAPVLSEHYTIEVLLRNTVVEYFRDGQRISKGVVGFGGTQISAPGEKINCNFKRSAESVHVFVPSSLVAKTYQEMRERNRCVEYEIVDPAYSADPIMGKLAWTLLGANSLRSPFSVLYCESLAMAVLARAMEFRDDGPVASGPRAGLQSWRLRRATEYIEDNLGELVTLNDIAEHTGLSRMHFAAQFKRATGLSPHAFLMQRRVETAKAMLIDDRLPIVQIAFAVGFHSQAHFTSAFRKATGTTPGSWRKQAIGIEVASAGGNEGP
jgi:AraC family transcriptional regulator